MTEGTDRQEGGAALGRIWEAAVPGEVPRYEIPGWRERFGVIAGITGRGPGDGPGFDLSLWTAAPVRDVMHRWRNLRHAEPTLPAAILSTQVHGVDVAWHDSVRGWVQLDGLDGHATALPGVLLTVTVADCVPIYLVAAGGRGIALLHSGWRGTAAGILERGATLLARETRSSMADIVMHCGVSICGGCYEVGSDVVAGCGVPPAGAGPWRLDLGRRLAEQARALGITEVTLSGWCSAHDRSLFYSHRASGGRDGRMAAYLGIAGPGASVVAQFQRNDENG